MLDIRAPSHPAPPLRSPAAAMRLRLFFFHLSASSPVSCRSINYPPPRAGPSSQPKKKQKQCNPVLPPPHNLANLRLPCRRLHSALPRTTHTQQQQSGMHENAQQSCCAIHNPQRSTDLRKKTITGGRSQSRQLPEDHSPSVALPCPPPAACFMALVASASRSPRESSTPCSSCVNCCRRAKWRAWVAGDDKRHATRAVRERERRHAAAFKCSNCQCSLKFQVASVKCQSQVGHSPAACPSARRSRRAGPQR
jgi:hypothetical protein